MKINFLYISFTFPYHTVSLLGGLLTSPPPLLRLHTQYEVYWISVGVCPFSFLFHQFICDWKCVLFFVQMHTHTQRDRDRNWQWRLKTNPSPMNRPTPETLKSCLRYCLKAISFSPNIEPQKLKRNFHMYLLRFISVDSISTATRSFGEAKKQNYTA